MRYVNPEDYLIHYGIKGQSWGKRRFQNTDGTLTAAGKARYYKKGTDVGSKGAGGYINEREKTYPDEVLDRQDKNFNSSTSMSYHNDSATKKAEAPNKSQEMARKYQDKSTVNKRTVIESKSALDNAGLPGWESLGKIRKANRISQEMARKYQDKSLKNVKTSSSYSKGQEAAKKFAGSKMTFNADSGAHQGKQTAGPTTFRTYGSIHNFGAVVGVSDGKRAPSKSRQTKWKGSTSASGFNNGIIEGSKKKKSRGTNIKGIKSGSKLNSGINNGKRPR